MLPLLVLGLGLFLPVEQIQDPRFDFDLRNGEQVLEKFYRGSLHTHSLRSDGDSSPEDILQWYKERGYHFVAMTDHNINSQPHEFSSLETDSFIAMPGEEVSYGVRSTRPLNQYDREFISVHGNALCAKKNLGGGIFESVDVALQTLVQKILESEALLQINHPNYESAFGSKEFLFLKESPYLLEVANQHPDVNNEGLPRFEGDIRESTETIWDKLLTAGQVVYGTATDDLHDIYRDPGFTPRKGELGWVNVAAEKLESDSLCQALKEGRFYSSTGIVLRSIQVTRKQIALHIEQIPALTSEENLFKTTFIGDGGQILQETLGTEVVYSILGHEKYVRARVDGPGGKKAWIQPVFLMAAH